MSKHLIFLTIPGLRKVDLSSMPNLMSLCDGGNQRALEHTFPCVTWPGQSNMLTGKTAVDHGVVANGFYWRDERKVEMWTAWNKVVTEPQIWDQLSTRSTESNRLTSAAWFPMLSKGCGADYVCMPAPIHQPDGSEDLWCYTKPQEFYGELLEEFGHFPLKHFWGPLANIKSSKWIADTSVVAAKKFKPNFFYIYLPHLDYAAQKFGPDSEQAKSAVVDLDALIGELAEGMNSAYGDPDWMVASEYVITDVDHVSYPNRVLRDAGLLKVRIDDAGLEHIDFETSDAWALVDHQFSHVFVRDSAQNTIDKVRDVFATVDGIEKVLVGGLREGLDHPRSGDIVLVSSEKSWQAYYWWLDDAKAPPFARTVDIHNKPGYDPVELCFDMETMTVPLDANLIKGSHGVAWTGQDCQGVLMSNRKIDYPNEIVKDTDIADIVLSKF